MTLLQAERYIERMDDEHAGMLRVAHRLTLFGALVMALGLGEIVFLHQWSAVSGMVVALGMTLYSRRQINKVLHVNRRRRKIRR